MTGDDGMMPIHPALPFRMMISSLSEFDGKETHVRVFPFPALTLFPTLSIIDCIF